MKNFIMGIVVLVVLFITPGVQASEPDIFEQPITAKFQNTELGSVFKQLSKDAGIQIVYDEKLSKKNVSGLYDNVPFLNVIQRLLSRENHTLTMDRQQKILFVRSFGESQYVSTDTTLDGIYLTDLGIPLNELRSLHAKQSEEYVANSKNMDEFFDEVSMTRGELLSMHEKQSLLFEQEKQNPDQYLTELDMTRGKLQQMLAKQEADFNHELSNDKAVLTETGMTRGEQREMLKNQVSEFETQQQDDAEYLPEIGITRGEHKRLLAQQSKKFEDHLTM